MTAEAQINKEEIDKWFPIVTFSSEFVWVHNPMDSVPPDLLHSPLPSLALHAHQPLCIVHPLPSP